MRKCIFYLVQVCTFKRLVISTNADMVDVSCKIYGSLIDKNFIHLLDEIKG